MVHLWCGLWGRFQQCLQNQQDSISNIVGMAFFNVLEIPCFVLEEQEACVAWYWWGGYVAAFLEPISSQRGSPGSKPRKGGQSVCLVLPVLPSGRGPGCRTPLGVPHNPVE